MVIFVILLQRLSSSTQFTIRVALLSSLVVFCVILVHFCVLFVFYFKKEGIVHRKSITLGVTRDVVSAGCGGGGETVQYLIYGCSRYTPLVVRAEGTLLRVFVHSSGPADEVNT